jgi:hypothetical protein
MANLLLNLRVYVFAQLNRIFLLWQAKSGKPKDKSGQYAGVFCVKAEKTDSSDRTDMVDPGKDS